jgi:ribonuclease VapC
MLAFEGIMERARIAITPTDEAQARLAHQAWRRFGKGRHAARLNLGDCFAYALSKVTGEPLLYKGGDFSRTDVCAQFEVMSNYPQLCVCVGDV